MCTSWSQRVREVLLNDLGVEFVWVEWMMLLAKDESSNLSHRITVNFEDLCQLLPLVTWFVHTKSFNFELTKRCVLNTLSQTRNDVDRLIVPRMQPSRCDPNHPMVQWVLQCHAPPHEECSQHHRHKGDPRVTHGACGAISERSQVILVWVRAKGVGNASHP